MLDLLSRLFSPVYCDAPEPWQIGFQDAGSPIAEGIQNLHNEIFFYLIVIFVGVGWVLGSVVVNYSQDKSPIVYKYANHGGKWLMCLPLLYTLLDESMGSDAVASHMIALVAMFSNPKGKRNVAGVELASVGTVQETIEMKHIPKMKRAADALVEILGELEQCTTGL
jgi:hypothetical protein